MPHDNFQITKRLGKNNLTEDKKSIVKFGGYSVDFIIFNAYEWERNINSMNACIELLSYMH